MKNHQREGNFGMSLDDVYIVGVEILSFFGAFERDVCKSCKKYTN